MSRKPEVPGDLLHEVQLPEGVAAGPLQVVPVEAGGVIQGKAHEATGGLVGAQHRALAQMVAAALLPNPLRLC
jgi:hypothetical protein